MEVPKVIAEVRIDQNLAPDEYLTLQSLIKAVEQAHTENPDLDLVILSFWRPEPNG